MVTARHSELAQDLSAMSESRKNDEEGTYEDIIAMHERSPESAGMYISIILGCYFLGLFVLLVHHVNTKYGYETINV